MTNKYLEKIAAFTGIELAATGALGAHASDRGDGAGGFLSGAVGGALGHKLGTGAGARAGGAYQTHQLSKIMMGKKVPVSAFGRGLKIAQGVRAASTVAGAYAAGKAYSKFKHRND